MIVCKQCGAMESTKGKPFTATSIKDHRVSHRKQVQRPIVAQKHPQVAAPPKEDDFELLEIVLADGSITYV